MTDALASDAAESNRGPLEKARPKKQYITGACAVDREFGSIFLVPLASFGCLWNSFGAVSAALRRFFGF